MARKQGPCEVCGEWVDRVFRPGRQRLCLPCATRKAMAQQRAMAEGTDPDLERCKEAGRTVGAQVAAREGPMYERWRNGMMAAAMR